MLIKEWQEKVLDNVSTHIVIHKFDDIDDDYVICDLVVMENGEIKETLANNRYYHIDELMLTSEELSKI